MRGLDTLGYQNFLEKGLQEIAQIFMLGEELFAGPRRSRSQALSVASRFLSGTRIAFFGWHVSSLCTYEGGGGPVRNVE